MLWLKALHIIFVVTWFAGLFYLPRLFVYHAQSSSKEVQQQLEIMERKLFWFMTPFPLLMAGFGIGLIYLYGMDWFAASKWLHYKFLLVIALFGYHFYLYKLMQELKTEPHKRSHKFYRVLNELPVLALFIIVILAVVKP